MSIISSLEAVERTQAGKGPSRELRRSGMVPGIIYGEKKDPEMCAMSPKTLNLELQKPGFFTTIFHLNVSGKAHPVLVKDVQFHPVTDQPLHIDFIRVGKDTRVIVGIPVRYINADKSPGIKKGGVLTVVVRNLEVSAPAHNIPKEIVVDLSGFEIHDSLHVDTLTFDPGVMVAHPERDYTLATISAPSKEDAADKATGSSE